VALLMSARATRGVSRGATDNLVWGPASLYGALPA
jgi:hypothetical protein